MEHPELRLLFRPAGSSKALIFIDGYLSEDKVRDNTLNLASIICVYLRSSAFNNY